MSNTGILGFPGHGQRQDEGAPGFTWPASSLPCASAGSRRAWGQRGAVTPCTKEKMENPTHLLRHRAGNCVFPRKKRRFSGSLPGLLPGWRVGEGPGKPLWASPNPKVVFGAAGIFPSLPTGMGNTCTPNNGGMGTASASPFPKNAIYELQGGSKALPKTQEEIPGYEVAAPIPNFPLTTCSSFFSRALMLQCGIPVLVC